jgi:hypothetical protein
MTDLAIRKADWASLRAHLIPRKHAVEQAAFLFTEDPGDGSQLLCREIWLLTSDDFVYQSASHIELSDSVRARIIKRRTIRGSLSSNFTRIREAGPPSSRAAITLGSPVGFHTCAGD